MMLSSDVFIVYGTLVDAATLLPHHNDASGLSAYRTYDLSRVTVCHL